MAESVTKFLTPEEVISFLEAVPESQIFTLVFMKKDHSIREMVARRGVTKYLAGGEKTTAHIKELETVYDLKAKDYRCFDMTKVWFMKSGEIECGKRP